MTAASISTTAPAPTRPPAPPGLRLRLDPAMAGGGAWTADGGTLEGSGCRAPGLIAGLDASLGTISRVALNLDAGIPLPAGWPWTAAVSAWAGFAIWTPTRSG
jgi:hypothetical protein